MLNHICLPISNLLHSFHREWGLQCIRRGLKAIILALLIQLDYLMIYTFFERNLCMEAEDDTFYKANLHGFNYNAIWRGPLGLFSIISNY